MFKAVLGLALTAVGCSAAGSDPAVDAPDVVLSPAPELVDVATATASRWSKASGLTIVVAPGGVPMRAVPDAVDPSGYRVCAFTSSSLEHGPVDMAVDVDPPAGVCRTLDQVVAHEIGHVIARTFAPADGDAHAASGVMRNVNGSAEIDAASLARVCEFAPCTVFQPE